MAATQGKSGLLAKMGDKFKKSWNKHRTKEVEYNQFADLPGGIVDGVAQICDAKFDKYKDGANKGQLYCYLAGTVVAPEEVNGVKVSGRRTSLTMPLCDTENSKGETRSFDDNVAKFVNTLKLLGLDTDNMEWDEIEEAVLALPDDGLHFNFSTRQGKKTAQYPNPRVFHEWGAACPAPDDVGDDTDDASGDDDGEASGNAYAPPASRNGHGKKGSANGNVNPKTGKKGPPPDDLEFGDLDSLVEKAEDGDAEAQNVLVAQAKEAGIAPLKIKKAKDYQALADLITEAKKEDEGDGDDESPEAEAEAQEEADGATDDDDGDDDGDDEEPAPPEVDDTVGYKPVDPKTKKPAKRAVKCEVIRVNSKRQTVDLQSLEDAKVKFSAVPWADLLPA